MSQVARTVRWMSPLSDLDLRVLAFERRRWNHHGSKEEAIVREFGVSATSYYQQLRALARRPEALSAEPMLVNRLRRRLR